MGIAFHLLKEEQPLIASLAVSFIFLPALLKPVANIYRLDFHATDWWLPFITGPAFIPPPLLSALAGKDSGAFRRKMLGVSRIVRLPMNKMKGKYF